MKHALAAAALCLAQLLPAPAALAASTDIVFKGGGTVTRTSGCTGRNPDQRFFVGTYLAPVAGSTNGPNTVVTLHFDDRSVDAFHKNGGTIGSDFERVWSLHISNRVDSYDPQMRITTLSPATITSTTQSLVVTAQVRGWDRVPNCVVTFTMRLVRDLQP